MNKAIVFYLLVLFSAIRLIVFSKALVIEGRLNLVDLSTVEFVVLSLPQVALMLWMISDILKRRFTTKVNRNFWLIVVLMCDIFGSVLYFMLYKKRTWDPKNSWTR